MKLAPGRPLRVALAFDPAERPLPVGRVALDAGLVADVIEEVRLAVADWPGFASEAGVSAASAKPIGAAHSQVRTAFESKWFSHSWPSSAAELLIFS